MQQGAGLWASDLLALFVLLALLVQSSGSSWGAARSWLWASTPRGGVGRGQVWVAPELCPRRAAAHLGASWFHGFGGNRGRKIPTLREGSVALGVAFLNPNQKSSKALNPEVLFPVVL